MTIKPYQVGLSTILFALLASGTSSAQTVSAEALAPKQLQIADRKDGAGPSVAKGDPVAVHYTGYLWSASASDNKGAKFDSSIDRGIPFGFIVGFERVIKGWDEGLVGMKAGGQRTLVIPPDKAYGEKGSGNNVPPNATLVFDIELMSIIGKTANATATASPFVPAKK